MIGNIISTFFLYINLTIIQAQKICTTPSFEDGLCVSYKQCAMIHNWYDKYGDQIPQYLLDYLHRSQCSENVKMINMCCKINQVIRENTVNMESLHLEGARILNELNCGNSNTNRISGGNKTNLNEYPWMALLRYNSPSYPFKCGGTLITDSIVLTAAHCVNRPVDPVVSVRLGEHDLLKDIDCQSKGNKLICAPPVEDFGIEKIIIHPKYSIRKLINDIALVRLDKKVDFKSHISPICLPITQSSIKINFNNSFIISGWGTTETGYTSNILLKASVKLLDHLLCEQKFKIEVNQKHICAGDLNNGRDTCKGDSGGPLFQLSLYKQNKKFVQYGVISFGGVDCNLIQMLPSLYSNIITLMPWITNNILY